MTAEGIWIRSLEIAPSDNLTGFFEEVFEPVPQHHNLIESSVLTKRNLVHVLRVEDDVDIDSVCSSTMKHGARDIEGVLLAKLAKDGNVLRRSCSCERSGATPTLDDGVDNSLKICKELVL